MIKRILFIFIIMTSSANADIRGLPSITVLAASSLTSPVTELARIYSREKNITVTASFDSTSEQAWKIEDGESADVFISSHPFWMSELKQMGLIDVYSLTNLVRNQIALVSSKNKRFLSESLKEKSIDRQIEYFNDRTIMVIGDPVNTALGMYTKQTIDAIDKKVSKSLWENISSRSLRAGSGKNAIYLVSYGETAGITYLSDAYENNKVNILSVIDESLHEPIIYQGAVVAGENMEKARDFMDFLQTDKAKKVFKKHGFIID